ncbi:MAG: YadA-like family protein [Pseudomonadota bacterium]
MRRPYWYMASMLAISAAVTLPGYAQSKSLDPQSAPRSEIQAEDTLAARVIVNETNIAGLQTQVGQHGNVLSNVLATLSDLNNARYFFEARTDAAPAQALGRESVALGGGSVALEDYTVSIGRGESEPGADDAILRRLTHLAPGRDDTDGVNVWQLNLLGEQVSENASDIFDMGTDIRSAERAITLLGRDVDAASALLDYLHVNSEGRVAEATGFNAIALGESTRASGSNAIAIGVRSHALFDNSIAIGAGAQASRSHQFMLSTPMMTYTLPGIVSPKSQAAQSGGLQLVTTDSSGNLAGDGGATLRRIDTQMASNAAQSQQNQQRLDQTTTQVAANMEEIGANTNLINQNSNALARHSEDIADNAATIADNSQSIQVNSNAIQTAQQSREDLHDEIDLLRAGYGGESERFDAVEAAMKDHDTRLDTTEQASATNSDAIAVNTNSISDVRATATRNQARIAESAQAISANTASIEMLQTEFERLDLSFSALSQQVAQSQDRIDQNTAGIAIANALAGSTWLQSNERAALTVNAGYFRGQSALAVSGAARLHQNWSANFAVGTAPRRGDVGARAGLRLGW